MFLTVAEAEKLPSELQKGLLVRQINFTIQNSALDPVKKTWLEKLNLGIKESIVRHLAASRSMDSLTKGLKHFAGYTGILPRPEDAQDCARLIEALMEGQNPARLHLDPACPVLAIVDPRLVGALRGLQANLFSPLSAVRRAAQDQLRMDDLVYTDGQGAIPARYIRMNREAIRSLVNDVGRSEAMFSLERGGALVADHIRNLMKRGIFSFKVPKIDPNHSTPQLTDDQRAKLTYDRRLARQKDSRQVS